MSVTIKREQAMKLARTLTPQMTEWEIERFAKDGGLLVAHGAKLYLHKQGAAFVWKLDGYAQDGSDVKSAMAHVNDQECKSCKFYLQH